MPKKEEKKASKSSKKLVNKITPKAKETKAKVAKAKETKAKATKAKETKAKATKAKETKAKVTKAKEAKAKATKVKETKAKITKAKETKAKVTKDNKSLSNERGVEKISKTIDKNSSDIKSADSTKISDQSDQKLNIEDFDWHNFEEGIEEVNEKKIKEFEKLVEENFVETLTNNVVEGTVVHMTEREAIIDINAK